MFHRIVSPSNVSSFFMFGARGVGKSTFLKDQWDASSKFTISLLEDKWEARYSRDPDLLIQDIEALHPRPQWIVIDEIQKVPKLLDIVHLLIEKKKYKFALTGSSSRKLKRGLGNLLAGRAFQYFLFPLTHIELQNSFNLDEVLQWGSLPSIFSLPVENRPDFLRAYCQTYLKEEILQEQLVRSGQAFRGFLEVAAQSNGETLNFSKMGRDVGVDTKTIQTFFQILEDTLIGFYLPAFHQSTRKSIKLQPKFYLFDLGVKRTMDGTLRESLTANTFGYGKSFEHWFICETFRINSYFKSDYNLYHYQTNSGGEIDLILKRGKQLIAVEIKSTKKVDLVEIRKLARVASPIKPKEIFYVSNDPISTTIDGVRCIHWKDFFSKSKLF